MSCCKWKDLGCLWCSSVIYSNCIILSNIKNETIVICELALWILEASLSNWLQPDYLDYLLSFSRRISWFLYHHNQVYIYSQYPFRRINNTTDMRTNDTFELNCPFKNLIKISQQIPSYDLLLAPYRAISLWMSVFTVLTHLTAPVWDVTTLSQWMNAARQVLLTWHICMWQLCIIAYVKQKVLAWLSELYRTTWDICLFSFGFNMYLYFISC